MPSGRMAAAIWGRTTEAVEWYPSAIMQMVQWGDFFYRRRLGIEATEEDIRHFALHQRLAAAFPGQRKCNTIWPDQVSWTIENDRFKLEIVPAGTR